MYKLIEPTKLKEWEIQHSSYVKNVNSATHEQCREYACKDISIRTTIKDIPDSKSFVIEIPEGKEFHFVGRVDTNTYQLNDPSSYYETFHSRNFISFSTINSKNISRYKGRVFYVYNILPEDIVHVFPLDSDTQSYAEREEELTFLPSLWLNLEELERLTEEMKVYNQITCKTKRNGKIITPSAVIAIDKIDEETQMIANTFGIGCIIIHPNKDAINYGRDLLYDCTILNSISYVMEREFGIDTKSMLYLD